MNRVCVGSTVILMVVISVCGDRSWGKRKLEMLKKEKMVYEEKKTERVGSKVIRSLKLQCGLLRRQKIEPIFLICVAANIKTRF